MTQTTRQWKNPKKMKDEELKKYNDYCTDVIKKVEREISYHSFKASKETNITPEDARQELTLKLYKNLWKFDPAFSALKTFCFMVLRTKRKVLQRSYLRKAKKFRRWNVENPVKIYDKIYFDNGEALEISTLIEDRTIHFTDQIENDQLYDMVQKQLDGEASQIFSMIRQGINRNDIANEIGKSRQSISNAIRRNIKPIAQAVVCNN